MEGSVQMKHCLLVSDLHGSKRRYTALFAEIEKRPPRALFLAGDLLPHCMANPNDSSWRYSDFLSDILSPSISDLRTRLGDRFPKIFAIMGNDDPRSYEPSIQEMDRRGLLAYVHARRVDMEGYAIYGYSYVPPTPFRLKDWERYDVSRYVDPGCVSPESGSRSVGVSAEEARYSTIQKDMEALSRTGNMGRTVLVTHSPPYETNLDRAALDGRSVDHVPLDVHVGSIALRRFIEEHQPHLTLHGHVHESARLTGSFIDRIGRTTMLSAAHDGPELCVVRFSLEEPEEAKRELI
jgi:Icc-related predicted phosphoesterase